MGIDDDFAALLPIGIKENECSASLRPSSQRFLPAVPDHGAPAAGVIANVVSVVGKFHSYQKLKGGPVVDPRVAIARGHEQPIGGGIVIQSLRFLQIWERLHASPSLEVQYLNRV